MNTYNINSLSLGLTSAQQYLSKNIEDNMRESIYNNGMASLVLTGGTSIKKFFSCLQGMNLPWDKVYILLSDDRLVSSDSIYSNEKMILDQFINDELKKKRVEIYFY